jgi:hypothetical protein
MQKFLCVKSRSVLLILCLLGLISCSKKGSKIDNPDDSSNPAYSLVKGSLTVPPFDSDDITALVPLGNLNPPAHTFPSDHMYFYCYTNKSSLNIKSPGNVHILRIARTHYFAGTQPEHYDYTIQMGSDKSYMYWSHVSNLSPRLMTAVNNFAGIACATPYSTGGASYEGCWVTVSLSATPGEILGTATANNGLAGMDLGVAINMLGDNPLDYFDPTAKAMLESKLGRYDGKTKRTAPPIAGEFLQDVSGTAQGNWIKQGSQKTPEDNNIALVKDNIIPSQLVFSVGNSVPGLNSGVYLFDSAISGLVNRKFTDVTPDGNTYCYSLGHVNAGFIGSFPIPDISMIIKLENATTLSVEKRNCDCTCLPYVFTANKVTYTR